MPDQRISIILEAIDQGATKTVQRVESSLSSLGSKASGVASAIKANSLQIAGLTTGLAAIGKMAISSAADMEQNRIAFQTMLGSADQARKSLSELSAFARKTPFQLPEVVTGAKQLLAYGTQADDIIPTFNALGNIAAGVGKDKLPQLILAFGQVKAATKLTGMELRQFTEAGVPLLEILAKQSGKTAAQIKQDMEDGAAPSFDDVKRAIFGMSEEGGKFFNLMDSQSHSFNGIISNIQDNIGRLARAIVGMEETGDIREGSAFAVLRDAAGGFQEKLDVLIPKIITASDAIAQNHTAVLAIAGAIAGVFVGALVILIATFGTAALAVAGFAAAGAALAATIPFWIGMFDKLRSGIAAVNEQLTYFAQKSGLIGENKTFFGQAGEGLSFLKENLHFASGGVVPGQGAVPIVAHGGEMVLNSEQQRTLFQSLNRAPSNTVNFGGVTINHDADANQFMKNLQRILGGQVEGTRMGVL